MDILTFKMWEDAAANSVGAGGVDGIGVGAKGEPGVHMKKKKKKKSESNRLTHNTKPGGDWEKRSKLSRDVRSKMWKDLGKKLKRK
jgi:hypothetical protein